MKANEAPEKIYLIRNISTPTALNTTNDCHDKYLHEWYKGREKDADIEYTRTDAFIEKALKWYCLDCECNDNCKDTKCFFYTEYERYLKGNTNALPPKFSERILNEDGSTSDNWRYRHFIAKIQDAFIEKAKKWFEKQNEWHDINGIKHCDMESFEDFIKYMEGE